MSTGSIGGPALVKWIENHRFFGRPKSLKRQQLTCQEAQSLADFVYTFSSCRELAAYTCVTPDAFTWTGDACVCSTLDSYNNKFRSCVEDTRYSACIDPNNEEAVSEWSSGHCDILDKGPTTPTTTSTPTPTPPVSAPDEKSASSTPEPKQPEPSAPAESKPVSTPEPPKSDPPKPSDPPSTLIPVPPSVAAPSSSPRPTVEETPKEEEKPKTPEKTPSSVPEPSLVPISVAPRVSVKPTDAPPSTPTIHVPLPKWTGTGNLLQGYCATPDYTIIDGPTAYWAPIVGCLGDKPDCCPFDIPPKTVVVGAIIAQTSSAQPQVSGASASDGSGANGGFPSALSPAQATIERCPNDYHRVGDGCCPSNYFPWSTAFGGQTPCYSTVLSAMTPPPIPPSLVGPSPDKPTSAIVNVVYAMQYPVQPEHKPALATPAKIGIGVGGGVAAIVFSLLTFLLIWKHRQHKKDKATLDTLSGLGSTRQSVAASSTVGGGVREWQKSVHHEGLEVIPEPTLPNVGMTQVQQYPSEWRPGHRSVSPPVPLPPVYTRNSIPSPVGYSEADSRSSIMERRYSNNNTPGVSSDGGYESTNRSELQTGEYGFPRQELQGVPEGEQFHPQSGYYGGNTQAWAHEGVPQNVVYHEAPAGRMTPRM